MVNKYQKNVEKKLGKLRVGHRPLLLRPQSNESIESIVRAASGSKRLMLKFNNGVEVALNKHNRKLFKKALKGNLTSRNEQDEWYLQNVIHPGINPGKGVHIRRLGKTQAAEGGFYEYLTSKSFPRYGLYTTFDFKNYENSCLYEALKTVDFIPLSNLEKIKFLLKDRNLTRINLTKISNALEVNIQLREYVKEKIQYHNHPRKKVANWPTVKLALYDSHYIIYEKVNERIKLENGKTKKVNNSLALIKHLPRKPMKEVEKNSIGYNNVKVENLEYDEKAILKFNKPKPVVPSKGYNVCFADFESSTEGRHLPYQLGYICDNDFFKCLEGNNLFTRMLDDIKKVDLTTLIYFHNAKYDSCFIDFDKITRVVPIIKGSTFYALNFFYKGCEFEVRDTYKHLSYPLKKFPQLFNIPTVKEVMPYKLYTQFNIAKRFVDISEAVDVLHESKSTTADIIQFRKNLDRWNLTRGNEFDILKYSKEYNRLDVEILKVGFNSWRSQVLQFTNLDIYELLTSSSLSQKYFENNGSFNGVNLINQAPRKFIQQSVFGGRCMASRNRKRIVTGKIQDFDAVSLYPSAIVRLLDLGGILKGLPKVLKPEQLNLPFLQRQDGYFIDVKIEYLKDRSFPLIPLKENGFLTYFTKNLIGKVITVGRIQLEDLINFCDCRFSIVRGYYFDEGRDPTICHVIKELFQQRLIYKREKNPIQETVKLLMNSVYGKTIMNEIDTRLDVVNADVYENHITRHYNSIKQTVPMGFSESRLVTRWKDVNEHYTRPHVGSEVLAMSKRIMNEVMCLAEDNKISIYYQDTDSIHLKKYKKLAKLFKVKYKRELIGKDLGQFHCDFDHKDLNDSVYSRKLILLGKKAYLDILKDDTGKERFHIRLKGVGEDIVKHYCKVNDLTPEQLYESLYKGENIKFDLKGGGLKPKFKIKSFCVESLDFFERVLKF